MKKGRKRSSLPRLRNTVSVKHRIQPHKPGIRRRTVNVGPQTPGPKYNVDVNIFSKAPQATFGKSKRFYLSGAKRRKSDSNLLKNRRNKVRLKPINYLSSFKSHRYTTRAFQRCPESNAGSFPRAPRMLGWAMRAGKGKKDKKGSESGVRECAPGPGQYNTDSSYNFLHNTKGRVFPKGKRNPSYRKTTPSPQRYRVKYNQLSVMKKPPSAVFTSGGRDYGYGHIPRNQPGPQNYNPLKGFNYVCPRPSCARFGREKKFPKPGTPGPSPLNYRPSYTVVESLPPRPTLYLYGP